MMRSQKKTYRTWALSTSNKVALVLFIVALVFIVIGLGVGRSLTASEISKSCRDHNGINIYGDYYHCTLMEEG